MKEALFTIRVVKDTAIVHRMVLGDPVEKLGEVTIEGGTVHVSVPTGTKIPLEVEQMAVAAINATYKLGDLPI